MELTYCDVCNQVITPHSKKHVLAVNTIVQEEITYNHRPRDMYEYMQEINRQAQKVKFYELCEGCQKVLKHLFQLRRDKLEKLKKDIEKIYNTKYDKEK